MTTSFAARPVVAASALFALVTAAMPAAASAETWTRLTTTGLGPGGRSSPAVASLGRSIYLFGGVRDDFTATADLFLDDLYRFDVTTQQWEAVLTIGARPPARAFAGAVANRRRGLVVVFGGASYGPMFSDFVAHDDLWALDPDARTWRQLHPKGAAPIGRSSPRLWIDGDRLYLFGGISAAFETLNDLWSYDFHTNRWRLLSANGAPGAPRSRHEAVGPEQPVAGRLLLYGGEHFDPDTGFETLGDVWAYDLGCGGWQLITPSEVITPPRTDAAAAAIGDRLYLQGGDLPGGSQGCGAPFAQNPTAELWRFDVGAHAWRRLTPQGDPLPRLKRHKAARVGDGLFVFAGWDFQCGDAGGPGQLWNLDVFQLLP
jgi:N-acetylneuraminic acid mutarotase